MLTPFFGHKKYYEYSNAIIFTNKIYSNNVATNGIKDFLLLRLLDF